MIECKQRYEFDCFLACIATAADQDYEKLWNEQLPPPRPGEHNIGAWCWVQRMLDKKGIFGADIDYAFARAGMIRGMHYWTELVPPYAMEFARRMLIGRAAIIQVPSMNYEGGKHIVYWDGENVHDPSQKQKYLWLQSMAIENIWLLWRGAPDGYQNQRRPNP